MPMINTFKKTILLFVIIILTPSYALAHGTLEMIEYVFYFFLLVLFIGAVWFLLAGVMRFITKYYRKKQQKN